MNHFPHFKNIVNFKYEIQYTNQIADRNIFMQNNYSRTLSPQNNHNDSSGKYINTSRDNNTSPIHERTIQNKEVHTAQSTRINKIITGISHVQSSFIQNIKIQEDNNCTSQLLAERSSIKKKIGSFGQSTITNNHNIKFQESRELRNYSNKKGLADISSLIMSVFEGDFKQNKKITCGEISQKILNEFFLCHKQSSTPYFESKNRLSEKQKKTIKRRVYDSINVLIALGKIRKQNKWLYIESIDKKMGLELIHSKQQKLAKIQRDYQQKKDIFDKVESQFNKLNILKKRNQELMESKEQGISTSLSTHSFANTQTFHFPLLAIYTPKQGRMKIQYAEKVEEQIKKVITVTAFQLKLKSDLCLLEHLSLNLPNQSSKIASNSAKIQPQS